MIKRKITALCLNISIMIIAVLLLFFLFIGFTGSGDKLVLRLIMWTLIGVVGFLRIFFGGLGKEVIEGDQNVKMKTQIKIAILAVVVFVTYYICQRINFLFDYGIDAGTILDLIMIPAIYALYVYTLMAERLRWAKWVFIIWLFNALRPVIYSILLLQMDEFAKAFLIWFEIGAMTIILWMGINGLKKCTTIHPLKDEVD